MASEIRVNKIENRSGLGTVTFADTGVDLAGIVTATTFSGSGASLTNLPAANVTGTLPAISGANLTNLAAANLTGTIADARFPATLPAVSAANLTNVPAANITGTLPALSAASLTSIPAANIVGVCTSGLANASGAFGSITRTTEAGALSGATNYDFTLPANCFRVDFVGHNISTSGTGTPAFRLGTSAGILASGHYSFGKSGTGNDYYSSRDQIDGFDTNLNGAADVGDMYMSFLSSSANNMWIFRGEANRRTQTGNMFIIGVPNLSGNALTTIRFFPYGTGFDSGRFSFTAYSIS